MADFFDETHHMLRDLVRDFVNTEILPYIDQWEEDELFPKELYEKAGERGILSVGFDEAYGGADTDIFHQLIVAEELTRSGSQGIAAGLGSHCIALPPIRNLGNEDQKQRFMPPVLAGKKIAALAISEAGAGSDVAAIRTKAERRGDHYRVNGTKMFITSGTRADLLTVAVRTGGPDHQGISLLVIEKDRPGVTVSRSLKKLGWRCSDTAELAFQDVSVPVTNLLGKEGSGFKAIMHNFQSERLVLAAMGCASAEIAYQAALVYARNRECFGKPLIAKQVIRHKLADMLTRIRITRDFIYTVAGRFASGRSCAADIAMAKNNAVETCDYVANEAVQIFGGSGCMRGMLVERIYRDSRILGIGGGTNEIMKEIICKAGGIS